jgi:hypothetical protein
MGKCPSYANILQVCVCVCVCARLRVHVCTLVCARPLACVPFLAYRRCPPRRCAWAVGFHARQQCHASACHDTHSGCAVRGDGRAWQVARPHQRVRPRICRMRTRTRTLWPERLPKASRPAPCSKVRRPRPVPAALYIYRAYIAYIYIYLYI